MSYNDAEAQAITQAKAILLNAGLSFDDLTTLGTPLISPPDHVVHHLASQHPPVQSASDICLGPPFLKVFSPQERRDGADRVNRKTRVEGLVDHPVGAVTEFPETGTIFGESIAHRFRVMPAEYIHPKDNIQYSLGGRHGMSKNIICMLLRDDITGEPVHCDQTKTSCESIKHCEFSPPPPPMPSVAGPAPPPALEFPSAAQDVFMKTLAFFCAIVLRGCQFQHTRSSSQLSDHTYTSESDSESDISSENGVKLHDSRADVRKGCSGPIVLCWKRDGRPYLKCEHHCSGQRGHFYARRLDNYDLNYLGALLTNDTARIGTLEIFAASNGYGPLAPCTFTAAVREQKQLCPTWHRDTSGILRRGQLIRNVPCSAKFDIYVPLTLNTCPYILIVARNPHSHPPPNRSKTPLTHLHTFQSLLRNLGWQLADATPRRLAINRAFTAALRTTLRWPQTHDPPLSALHPSLGNLDHVARLVNDLRREIFPDGTGLKGAERLYQAHELLPLEQRYVRWVQNIHIPSERNIQFIICMLPAMSRLLVAAKRVSIDTAFKRAQGYEEFEIECWLHGSMKSVTCARVFITSQSAAAHQILFENLFRIAALDAAKPFQIRHIHGVGLETVVADAHKGQGLGLGQACMSLVSTQMGSCAYHPGDPTCDLQQMTAYDHLAHLYIQCTNHFERAISKLGNDIPPSIRDAMRSMASAYPVTNFEQTKELIRHSGPKAAAWLADKETGTPFMIPALYQPASKIPLEIWQASPPTTNGNEQAHSGVNRDGTKLTLVAAISRGLEFDSRAMASIELSRSEHIHARDQAPTDFRRAARSLTRKVRSQQQQVEAVDQRVTEASQQRTATIQQIVTQAALTEVALVQNKGFEAAARKLHTLDYQRCSLEKELLGLAPRSSGKIVIPDFYHEPPLFNPDLIAHLSSPSPPKSTRRSSKSQAKRSQGGSKFKPRMHAASQSSESPTALSHSHVLAPSKHPLETASSMNMLLPSLPARPLLPHSCPLLAGSSLDPAQLAPREVEPGLQPWYFHPARNADAVNTTMYLNSAGGIAGDSLDDSLLGESICRDADTSLEGNSSVPLDMSLFQFQGYAVDYNLSQH